MDCCCSLFLFTGARSFKLLFEIDFVIELRSRTDKLQDLQEKMLEYLDAGLCLGWLINPQQQQVEIYRQNQDKEIISLPANLSGEDILPNFVLDIPIM